MKINLGTLIALILIGTIGGGLLFVTAGGSYGQIESFKVQNVEVINAFFGQYKMIGTDGNGKVAQAYSSSYSKSIRSELFGNAGICYNMYGFTLPGEDPTNLRVVTSFVVDCNQNQ